MVCDWRALSIAIIIILLLEQKVNFKMDSAIVKPDIQTTIVSVLQPLM